MMAKRSIAPFSGRALPLDWKRMVGLVTLLPLRIVLLTPLLILVWLNSRIGEQPYKLCSLFAMYSDRISW